METSSTDKRLDEVSDRQGRFEGDIDRRFERVDQRFDKIDERFDRFEDKVDRRFERAEADVKERFDQAAAVEKERFEQAAAVERGWFGQADTVEKERFAVVGAELAAVTSRLDRMNRRLVGGFVTITVAVVAKFLTG